MSLGKVEPVVLMVAWQKKHRCRPVRAALANRKGRKPLQPKVADIQAAQQRTALVRTDVTGQYQQICAGQRLRFEMGVRFEV